MQRLTFALLLVTSFASLAGTSWAQAVAIDATSLMKRLDAIEAKINTRASSGGAAVGGAYSTNDIQSRLDDLETESSQMRGNTDRATQAIELLAKRFDDFAKDMDMRLGDIENRMDEYAKNPPAAAATTPAATTPAATTPAATTEPAAEKEKEKPATSAATTSNSTIPADMSASDHYNKAYAYLTATDYKSAQTWFEEFLKRHPKDALADNAYYWLGEVYLVQNNPNAAVGKFRDGLKAFPKGAKASANLYKMGVALEQLKQPKLAKAAWGKLVKDFPNAPETAKAKDKMALIKE